MLLGRSTQPRPDSQSWGQQHGWHGYNGGRHQWTGHRHSGEDGHIEGLNEEGEAPPPYMPKSDEISGRAEGQIAPRSMSTHAQHSTAIPMQNLARVEADEGRGSAPSITTGNPLSYMPPGYNESHRMNPSPNSGSNVAGSSQPVT